jgi:transcriptional regulator with GAF, ATPase, and Fis domain
MEKSETKAWLYFSGKIDNSLINQVTKSLERAGILTHQLDRSRPSGPGLLVFEIVTLELYECIRELTRNGIERVLTIPATTSAINTDQIWELLRAGASDVFAWDQSEEPGNEIAAKLERWEVEDRLTCSPLVQDNLVGQSPIWTCALRQIVEVAYFTNASVLITGESGTGKELVARLIHTLDQRPNKRELVIVDCTTIVPELAGSEFFGHERGAFTGAVMARDGAFALANGGTLFLDEVAELPFALQAELLRAIQERTYKRVGSNVWQQTEFRLVCVTNKDLTEAVAKREFRSDLYYRIANWTCKLPALRDRLEDILQLVDHFAQQLRPGTQSPKLTKAVQEYLLKRIYPGNVRDLKQLVSRIMYRHVGPGPITVGDIPEEERPSTEVGPVEWRDQSFENSIRRAVALGIGLKEIGRTAEETAIRITVGAEEGNLRQAARRLGVTDRALQMRRATKHKREQEHGTG